MGLFSIDSCQGVVSASWCCPQPAMPRVVRSRFGSGRGPLGSPIWATLVLLLLPLFSGFGPEGSTVGGVGDLYAQSVPWSVEGQLGGSFFFGNRDQTNFSTRAEIERADSLFESTTEFRFLYGTQTDDEGVTSVSARSWGAASQLDFRPEAPWQPFVGGSIESSFERRIALRYDTGAGFKVSFRGEDGSRNRVDFSVSILAERTYARETADQDREDEVSLTRWSSTFRVRRGFFDDRLYLDTNNRYRPVFDSFATFRLNSDNSLSYELTEVVALRFSVQTEYDSRAVERGADTNYDGRTEVSVVARF